MATENLGKNVPDREVVGVKAWRKESIRPTPGTDQGLLWLKPCGQGARVGLCWSFHPHPPVSDSKPSGVCSSLHH